MEKLLTNLAENYQHYIDQALEIGISGALDLVMAILIYLVGKRVARWLTNTVVKALKHNEVDEELTGFLEGLIYWALLVLVVIAALGQLGIQTASFITVLGAGGLAVGLALQGSLSNFAAGVLILILRPFDVDDWVDMAGVSGKVRRIKVFTTELLTGDNKCVIIPNSRVLDSNIINHSSTGVRRVDLVFGVGYDDDLSQVKKVIQGVVDADERIMRSPATLIAVAELADSSVNLNVRPWVKSDDYWDVYYSLTEKIKAEFDANGISIPFPQQVVHRIDS